MLRKFQRGRTARAKDVRWEFRRCGVVGTVTENLTAERWRKLAWNIPFNGLSVTAGGVDTATIMAHENLRATALALMDEVIAGANRCGYAPPSAVARQEVQRSRTAEMAAGG